MMKIFQFQEKPNGDLILCVDRYSPTTNNKIESVFCQANGHIGIRGTQDFACLNRKPQTYLAGLYHQGFPEEPDELVNLPDLTGIQISIGNSILCLDDASNLIHYHRTFNLTTNEICSSYEFSIHANQKILIESSRFVSYADKSFFCQRWRIKVEGETSSPISIQTGIDGQVSNEGVTHLRKHQFRAIQDTMIMQAECGTQTVQVCSGIQCSNNVEPILLRKDYILPRRRIFYKSVIQPAAGEVYEFIKISRIVLSKQFIDQDDALIALAGSLQVGLDAGYDKLLDVSRWAAQETSKANKIEIEGLALEEKCLISFANHQLIGMMPDKTPAYSIGGKGLTGEGYRGHVFWDTEIYLLPFFTNLSPEIAANLLQFRLNGLPGACQKARDYKFEGALFPWEVTTDGLEKTPPFAQMNIHTGKANPVWSALKEHHISADISYAIQTYVSTIGNTSLLYHHLFPVVIETALFWCSRITKTDHDKKYHILDIIGPDEYTEHVDDNAYTNFMAYQNVDYARQICANLKKDPEAFHKWAGVYDLLDLEKRFDDLLSHLYLPQPNEKSIIPQDTTFLSKPLIVDLEKYKNHPLKQAILLDYSREEVVNHQVLKQADVVMLQVLQPDLFNNEVKKANLDFYEPKTVHDSSLSPSIHAIAYADIGLKQKSYEYFLKALEVDVNDNLQDSTDGLHAAALGGIWLTLIRGFTGIVFHEDHIQINPRLPNHWNSMHFQLRYLGNMLDIKIDHSAISISLESFSIPGEKHPIRLTVHDQIFQVESSIDILYDKLN